MTAPEPSSFKDRNFLLLIFYEGPWERLQMFLLGVRPDCTVRWVIPAHPAGWRKALESLADKAEQRDAIWRAKYAIHRKNPPVRWKRRML